jgi:hypothetical protein
MGLPNDLSTNAALSGTERRSRRASCLADALRFQLDACREAEGLSAIVVSDDLGFCVSHSGGEGEHAELAAQLPILVGPHAASLNAEGDTDQRRRSLVVTTFSAAGETLHACAVESRADQARAGAGTQAALQRVASGFSRMLAQ